MKNLLLIGLLFIISWSNVIAQTFFVETKPLPIRQYNALETQLHSVRLPDKDITVLGAAFTFGPAQQYSRTATALRPRPVVSYTYSLPDSVVRSIELEVDSSNYLGDSYEITSKYREPQSRYPQFLNAYERIRQEMNAHFGKPAENKPAHKTKSALGEAYEASAKWETPELRATIFLVFTIATKAPVTSSNGYSVSASNTYRIRANISYKNLAKPAIFPTSPQAGNPKQLAVAEKYLSLLLSGKLAESWQLLGPTITQSISYEQYRNVFSGFLATLTAPEKGASLFSSGPSFTTTGQTYAMYSFRLNSDAATPPLLMLNLLFKDFETELIEGVQPQSRSEQPLNVK